MDYWLFTLAIALGPAVSCLVTHVIFSLFEKEFSEKVKLWTTFWITMAISIGGYLLGKQF